MSGRDTKYDQIREEALDWVLRIEAAPDDADLRSSALAWRRQSPLHEKAWRFVTEAWQVAGRLPRDYADRAREAASLQSLPQPTDMSDEHGRSQAKGDTWTAWRNGRALPGPRVAIGVTFAAIFALLLYFAAPAAQLLIQADHVTGVGETRRITMDDGSTVHLDAESAVAIDYDNSRRTVQLLAGQAFFDVVTEAGRPFVVPADGLTVTVKGTSFSVGLTSVRTSVSVLAGSVEVAVERPGGEQVLLAHGDQLTLTRSSGAIAQSKVQQNAVASWRNGRLLVDGMPFGDLIELLGRYHRGVIWLGDADLATRQVVGAFNLSDPIAALNAAATVQGAAVTELTPFFLVVTAR